MGKSLQHSKPKRKQTKDDARASVIVEWINNHSVDEVKQRIKDNPDEAAEAMAYLFKAKAAEIMND